MKRKSPSTFTRLAKLPHVLHNVIMEFGPQHRSKWNMVMAELQSPKVCAGTCKRQIDGPFARVGPNKYECQTCKSSCHLCHLLINDSGDKTYHFSLEYPEEVEVNMCCWNFMEYVCVRCTTKCSACHGNLGVMFTEGGEKCCQVRAVECQTCHVTSARGAHDHRIMYEEEEKRKKITYYFKKTNMNRDRT